MPKSPPTTSSATSSMASETIPSRPAKPYPDRLKIMHLFPDRPFLSLIPHDIMYGPQAALIAECFPGRLRYSGASIGYQLASVIAGGPAPLIVAWLLAEYKSGWVIAGFILACAVISLVATAMLPDNTNKEIAED